MDIWTESMGFGPKRRYNRVLLDLKLSLNVNLNYIIILFELAWELELDFEFGFNLNFAHNVILLKPFDELKLIAVLSNFPCNLSTDCKSSLC